MRGKAPARRGAPALFGITPAHAGKSEGFKIPALNAKDHPRPCGEKCQFFPSPHLPAGSPPPMRGKEKWWTSQEDFDRITPAHAGKRIATKIISHLSKDHPRPCGEKRSQDTHRDGQEGSPPPMRGKVILRDPSLDHGRITPAHAGKRRNDSRSWRRSWDHPRPCGEKVQIAAQLLYFVGSPPPMRGKGQQWNQPRRNAGITPAHAGKSLCLCRLMSRDKDHPRPCGEKKPDIKPFLSY